MNNRGQVAIAIASVIIAVISIIIVAPIIVKVVGDTTSGFSTAINQSNTEGAQEAAKQVTSLDNGFRTVLDGALFFGFILLILIMLISSFLVGNHPAFIIVYILSAVFVFAMNPFILQAADSLYTQATLSDAVNALPLLNFVRENFGLIMLGVYIVSGIIMFARLRQ